MKEEDQRLNIGWGTMATNFKQGEGPLDKPRMKYVYTAGAFINRIV